MKGSAPWSWSKQDFINVSIRAAIVGAATGAAYWLATFIPSIDNSTPVGMVLAMGAGALVDLIHKYLANTG